MCQTPAPAAAHPYGALHAALYADAACTRRRTPADTLHRVLRGACVVGGPCAATAVAAKAAPPTAACGAVREHGTQGWRPLVWLRPDQAWAAYHALECRCAVLVAGAAVPLGWEVR